MREHPSCFQGRTTSGPLRQGARFFASPARCRWRRSTRTSSIQELMFRRTIHNLHVLLEECESRTSRKLHPSRQRPQCISRLSRAGPQGQDSAKTFAGQMQVHTFSGPCLRSPTSLSWHMQQPPRVRLTMPTAPAAEVIPNHDA